VLRNALTNPTLNDSVAVELSNLSGVRSEVSGMMNNERIFYSHITLKGEKEYYQLCVWTRGEDRKLLHKETMDAILQSFTKF
jgi:hypothetical protein